MKRKLFIAFIFLSAFALPAKKRIKVFIAGDSTAANKEVKAFPETGWGMPFAYFFDSTVTVDNRAKNGRSTRTFITEGLWQKLINDAGEGDYVFIQFGHNDEVESKKSYTTPGQYADLLTLFVTEARAKKAIPVLLTPVARRKFDATGRVQDTHEVYANLMREVAKKNNVPLIDLDVKGQAMIQQFGVEGSKMLFDYLQPGEHPNYPEGKADDTHFSELGARKVAEIVLAEIKALDLPLAQHIYQPPANK